MKKRKRKEYGTGSVRTNNPDSYLQYAAQPQQQPPPALPTAVGGIAEPPLDYNGKADMKTTIDEEFTLLYKELPKEQPQQQQPPNPPVAAVQGIAELTLNRNDEAHKEITMEEIFAALDDLPQMQQPLLNTFDDNYSNFDNFYIDNSYNDVFAGDYFDDTLFEFGQTTSSNFDQPSVVLPASDPYFAPSPTLPPSPLTGILPQPNAVSQVPLATTSCVDTAVLAPVCHEFSADD